MLSIILQCGFAPKIALLYIINLSKKLIFSTAAPKLNVPPRFRDTAFFDKGENVVVKIPFTGFPKPKISWYRGEEKIESGGHYHVEVKVSVEKNQILGFARIQFKDWSSLIII